MLDIGFSELLLIAVVGLIVIGPKDLPHAMRHVMRITRELRAVYSGIRRQVTQLMDEAGIDTLKRDVTTIIDLEGKPQQAYDVNALETLSHKPADATPKADV